MSKTYTRTCRICGKTFESSCRRACLCSKLCRLEARRLHWWAEKESLPPNPRVVMPKRHSSLDALAEEAHAKGISYGQLQAQKYLAALKEKEQQENESKGEPEE